MIDFMKSAKSKYFFENFTFSKMKSSDYLTDILFYRNGHSQTREDVPLSDILMQIPVVERQKINKFSDFCSKNNDFELCVSNFPVEVSYTQEFISSLLNITPNKNLKEIYTVLAQFAIIGWCQNINGIHENEFLTCSVIQIIKFSIQMSCEYPINCYFSLVCSKYYRDPVTSLNPVFVRNTFELIENNIFNDSSFYSKVILVFRTVSYFGQKEQVDYLIQLIEKMMTSNAPCLDVKDKSAIVVIIQQNIANLDIRAFGIACKVTKDFDSKVLSDSFVIIPSSLLSYTVVHTKISKLTLSFDENEEQEEEKEADFGEVIPKPPIDELGYVVKDDNPVKNIAKQIAAELTMATAKFQAILVNSMLNLIETLKNPEYLINYFSAFLVILRKIASAEILSSVLVKVTNNIVFSPKLCFFSKTGLLPEINSLRQRFVKCITKISPSLITNLLDNRYPKLVAEYLLRAMICGFDPTIFAEESVLSSINSSIICLRSISHEKSVIDAQYGLFNFLAWLLVTKETSLQCLSSQSFASAFTSNLYEPKLTKFTLRLIRDALSKYEKPTQFTGTALIFIEASRVIANCKGENRHFNFGYYLSECLDEALCPETCQQFEPCLDQMLTYVSHHPNAEVLSHILKFIRTITIHNTYYLKNIEKSKAIINTIKIVEKEPSLQTYDILLTMMGAGTSVTPIFLIKSPWSLPIILSVFGESKHFEAIIRKFYKLAQQSDENCRMLHAGGLDLILMKYADIERSNKEFDYYGIPIKFNMSSSVWENVAQPLLFLMFRAKSNNAVASLVAEHCRNAGSFSSQIINELIIESNMQSKKFPIGLLPASVKVQIPQEKLKSQFSISFKIKPDPIIINLTTQPIYLISFKNTQFSVSIYIYSSSIYAMYLLENKPAVRVILSKKMKMSEWSFYVIGVNTSNSPVSFSTYTNNDWQNESELVSFKFTEDTLMTIAGGGTNMCCGYISDVCLHEGFSNKDNPIIGEKFFSSDSLKTNGFYKELTTPYHIVMETTKAAPKILIDCIVRSNNHTEIAKYFLNPQSQEKTLQVLEIIRILFTFSPSAQKRFSSCSLISKSIAQHKELSSYEVYVACWRVFESITNDKLKSEWFDSIIFNTWLWVNSGPESFIWVLKHWSSVVLSNAEDIIKSKEYFKTFISQFKLFFCFTLEGRHETNVKSLPLDQYSKEDIQKCNQMFTQFLKRLAKVHLTIDGIKMLITHMSTCGNKNTILQILDLTLSISDQITSTENYTPAVINGLHYFLDTGDLDVIEKTLLVVHQLAGDQLNKFLQSAAFQLNRDMNPGKTYKRLFTNLESYPNLYSLLIILALRLEESLNDIAQILERWTETNRNIYAPLHWFIWPLIAALQNDETCPIFSKFIASRLVKSQRRDTEIYDIVYFARFINQETPLSAEKTIRYLFEEISKLNDPSDSTFTEAFGYLCFTTSVFHFSPPTHSKVLLELASQSPYPYIKIYNSQPTVFQSVLTDIVHLEHVMYFDVTSMQIGFYYQRNEDGSWKDKDIAELALRVMTNMEQKDYLRLLLNPEQFQSNEANSYKKNMLSFYESELEKFKKSFIKNLVAFVNSYRGVIDDARQSVADTQIFTSYSSESVKAQEQEHQKWVKMNENNEQKSKRVRDRTLCINYCAVKTKIEKEKTAKSKISVTGEPIYEQNATLISLKSKREITLTVTKDAVYISGRNFIKAFYIKMVKLLLTRRRNAETAVEFFLSDGRSYLIDLFPVENTVFVDVMKKLFNEKQFIQTTSSDEVFKAFPITIDWLRGVLSNFEYLMKLNILSGRSFNDPSLYPIFPSVINSYQSDAPSDISRITFNIPNIERVGKTPVAKTSLQDCIVTGGCIAPEFFFLPSVVVEGDVLPKWASNKFEFIYKHRQTLESQEVRELLPKFVDTMWGVKMKLQQHRQIFLRAHPQSSLIKIEKPQRISKQIKEIADIQYIARQKSKNPMAYSLLLFTNDGSCYNYYFSIFTKFVEKEAKNVFTLKQDDFPVFEGSLKGIIRLSTKYNQVYTIKDMKATENSIYTEVPLISYCDKSFLFCPDTCSVGYCIDGPKCIVPLILAHTKSTITKLASYSNFKVFAIACDDGTVEVHSIKDGQFVGSSKINGQPMHLFFTSISGYLVCASSTELLIMTVDGEEIKRTKLKCPFKAMFQFNDLHDFDYIIAIDSEERFIFFDAMKSENMTTVFIGAMNTIYATYNAIKQCFVHINSDGILTITPYVL